MKLNTHKNSSNNTANITENNSRNSNRDLKGVLNAHDVDQTTLGADTGIKIKENSNDQSTVENAGSPK